MSENLAIQIKRVALLSFIFWIKDGFMLMWRNALKTLTISAIWMIVFAVFMIVGKLFAANYIASIIISIGLSLILPLLIASLAAAVELIGRAEPWRFRQVFALLRPGATIRLIIIYVLMSLVISLGSQYLAGLFPANEIIFNLVMDVLLLFLQLVILISLPMSVYQRGITLPFRALGIGLRGLVINFIPCILFLICIFLLILLALAIALLFTKLLGEYALIIYIIEMVLFLTCFGLSSAVMSERIVEQN
jgi:hypothetical protein